ncbi:MAG: DUF4156 domain-containing protein [Rickettsiales bacterium]|jgi:hypothetical protein|nr:DUF4156 domain-containing protein [Rickettsiales bacterium]
MRKFLILPLLAACTTTAQTPEGMAVRIVDEKPQACESLGDLDTMGNNFSDSESLNYIRNRTAKAGGNTLRISKVVNYSYVSSMVIGSNDYYAHYAYMYKCGS